VLVDTSVLLRTLQPQHPLYALTDRSIEHLLTQGRELHIVAQNLIELWIVATRSLAQNGLGMTPAAGAGELARIKSMFAFLPETPAIYPIWETLVIHHNVTGKRAHDARLVAAMQAHGLTSILTFAATGFSRYAGIEVVHPAAGMQQDQVLAPQHFHSAFLEFHRVAASGHRQERGRIPPRRRTRPARSCRRPYRLA